MVELEFSKLHFIYKSLSWVSCSGGEKGGCVKKKRHASRAQKSARAAFSFATLFPSKASDPSPVFSLLVEDIVTFIYTTASVVWI
jgi:hypothetical protein